MCIRDSLSILLCFNHKSFWNFNRISCEAAFGYEQVAKRTWNIRLTQEKNMMNIGNVIKKYRKELGYTQEEMAKRLGVTTPAVNKWENGVSHSLSLIHI